MNQDVVSKLMNVLQVYESAPGAHILVKSMIATVTDSEVDEIYDSSEGYNDSCTEDLLKSLSTAQIQDLVDQLKAIDDEHRANLEQDEYEEHYSAASHVLSSI